MTKEYSEMLRERKDSEDHWTIAAVPNQVALCNLSAPSGFATLISQFAKEVIRNHPENIASFAVDFFDGLRKEKGIIPSYSYPVTREEDGIGMQTDKQEDEDCEDDEDITEIPMVYRQPAKRERRPSGMFPTMYYDPTIPQEIDDSLAGMDNIVIEDADEIEAVIKIQAAFKGNQARKMFKRMSIISEKRSSADSVVREQTSSVNSVVPEPAPQDK